jgi:hypothetical protein
LDLGAHVFQVGVTTSLPGVEEEAELLDLATLDVVEGGYFSSSFYGWTMQRR